MVVEVDLEENAVKLESRVAMTAQLATGRCPSFERECKPHV